MSLDTEFNRELVENFLEAACLCDANQSRASRKFIKRIADEVEGLQRKPCGDVLKKTPQARLAQLDEAIDQAVQTPYFSAYVSIAVMACHQGLFYNQSQLMIFLWIYFFICLNDILVWKRYMGRLAYAADHVDSQAEWKLPVKPERRGYAVLDSIVGLCAAVDILSEIIMWSN